MYMLLFLDPNIFRYSFFQFLANIIFFCHDSFLCLSRFVPFLLAQSQGYLTICCLTIYYLSRCYLNIYYQTGYYLTIRGRNIVLLTRCYLTIRGRNIVLLTRCLISCSPPQTSVTKDLGLKLGIKGKGSTLVIKDPT